MHGLLFDLEILIVKKRLKAILRKVNLKILAEDLVLLDEIRLSMA